MKKYKNESLKAVRRHESVGMRAGDLRKLYTYLKLLGRVYTDFALKYLFNICFNYLLITRKTKNPEFLPFQGFQDSPQ